MHEYGSLPRARQNGLLEETVGEELLLYDQGSHTAHCLSPVAACVWRRCDGEHDVTELAELVGASKSLVADALHELREKGLFVAEPEPMQDTVAGVSRREVIVRGARYGAAAAAVPLIVSATAATPAMASSGEEIVSTCVGGFSGVNCCKCFDTSKACVNKDSGACTTYCGSGGVEDWQPDSMCK
ncbi:MAG TPA: PqqD family protein [Solirubrobacteraceae bacterium]|jgi:hypothetical protein|nr:PqqD family protein [Solirubrobacteraceae bacterium]